MQTLSFDDGWSCWATGLCRVYVWSWNHSAHPRDVTVVLEWDMRNVETALLTVLFYCLITHYSIWRYAVAFALAALLRRTV